MSYAPEDRFEAEEFQWYDECGEPAPNGRSRHPAVYFLLDESENALKVGTACNVNQRLCDLQVGCCRELKLVGWVPGGKDAEQALHEAMPEQRISGEWYRMTPEILAMVRSVCAENRKRLEAARVAWRLRLQLYVESPDRGPTDLEVARAVAAEWPLERTLEVTVAMAHARVGQSGPT